MESTGDCLGICYADHQLFYAVNDPSQLNLVRHIGCINFNFIIQNAVSGSDESGFSSLRHSLARLQEKFSCSSSRLLTPAIHECWTAFPRLVYETPDEREDHLAILMADIPRQELETTWYELSNTEYRLLMIRRKSLTERYQTLLSDFSQNDLVSEFELGMEWQQLTGLNGAWLTVHCQPGYLAVSSYLLGRLRGATFLPYETIHDLPYLWDWHSRELTWMNGFHDQIYLFGPLGLEVSEVLASEFAENGEVLLMNSLSRMQVEADERTYGFKLESSFPAILLSLNLFDQTRHALNDPA